MATELLKELIGAGIHFGHRASRWNPKMRPYIFGRRNLIHIIDVKETLKGILLARKFLTQVAASGKDILFVGTKRQARRSVEQVAAEIEMHSVTNRWLGGTLTNFREIRKRVGRLDHLEQLEADGMLDTYSKKEGSTLRREMRKIRRNLGGIRRMDKLPGAIVIIDQRREVTAIREARKLAIPIVCLLDTDSDPDLVDIAIPGNDDAMRAIELILRELCEAARAGIGARAKGGEEETKPEPRRRSQRPTTARAQAEPKAPPAEAPPLVPAEAPADEAVPQAAEPAPSETPEAPAPAPAPAPAQPEKT